MPLGRNKLYLILSVACIAGYGWLAFNNTSTQLEQSSSVEVCLIKHVTNIPCPSCGSTRSVLSLMEGNVQQSLYLNPMGILIALIMLLAPIWILFDIASKKSSLHTFYNKIEYILRQPKIALPLILLVIINWIWNIAKGL